jgi:hypothetical protein
LRKTQRKSNDAWQESVTTTRQDQDKKKKEKSICKFSNQDFAEGKTKQLFLVLCQTKVVSGICTSCNTIHNLEHNLGTFTSESVVRLAEREST